MKYEFKGAVLGPADEDGNQVVKWTQRGLEYEGDLRQVKTIIQKLGFEDAEVVATPAVRNSIDQIDMDEPFEHTSDSSLLTGTTRRQTDSSVSLRQNKCAVSQQSHGDERRYIEAAWSTSGEVPRLAYHCPLDNAVRFYYMITYMFKFSTEYEGDPRLAENFPNSCSATWDPSGESLNSVVVGQLFAAPTTSFFPHFRADSHTFELLISKCCSGSPQSTKSLARQLFS